MRSAFILACILAISLVHAQVDDKNFITGKYYLFIYDSTNASQDMKDLLVKLVAYVNPASILNVCGNGKEYSDTGLVGNALNKESITNAIVNNDLVVLGHTFSIEDIMTDFKNDLSTTKKHIIILGNDSSFYGIDADKIAVPLNYKDIVTYIDFSGSSEPSNYFTNYMEYASGFDIPTEFSGYLISSPCAIGQFRNSEDVCQNCELGHYCPDGLNEQYCPTGTYADVTGLDTCKNCPAGHHCEDKESVLPCDEDLYSAEGDGSCGYCPVNYACTVGSAPEACRLDQFSPEKDTICYDCIFTIFEHDAQCEIDPATHEISTDCFIPRAENIQNLINSDDYTYEYDEEQNQYKLVFKATMVDNGASDLFLLPVVKDIHGNTVSTNCEDFEISDDKFNFEFSFIISAQRMSELLYSESETQYSYGFRLSYEYYASESHEKYLDITVGAFLNVNRLAASSNDKTLTVIPYEDEGCDCTINEDVPSAIDFLVNGNRYTYKEFEKLGHQYVLNEDIEIIHYITEPSDQARFHLGMLNVKLAYSTDESVYDVTDLIEDYEPQYKGNDYEIYMKIPLYLVGPIKITVISQITGKRNLRGLRNLDDVEGVESGVYVKVVDSRTVSSSHNKIDDNWKNILLYCLVGLLSCATLVLGSILGYKFYKYKQAEKQAPPTTGRYPTEQVQGIMNAPETPEHKA